MEEILELVGSNEGPLAYAILALSAAIEHVFPPFPGDTVTLFGAFLVVTEGWSLWAVFGAVTVGSLVGATVDYLLGARLARDPTGASWLARAWAKTLRRAEPLMERLRERGEAYIVWNRFLPGVRAAFFVAAGMAGLRLWAVLLYAAVSAVAWNALVIAAGLALGESWERLRAASGIYAAAAWALILVVAAVLAARAWRRRAFRKLAEPDRSSDAPS